MEKYGQEGELPYLLHEAINLVEDDVIEVRRGWVDDIRPPFWAAFIFILIFLFFGFYSEGYKSFSSSDLVFFLLSLY